MIYKVSVIMGIYNCDRTLELSLNSLLEQTFQDFEVIMCDDGSTDNTYDIANDYVNKYPEKFILIKNESNQGLHIALNKCLKIAKGKYIARQDGDDISLPTRLEKEYNFLENNYDYDIVSTAMIHFDEQGDYKVSIYDECPTKYSFLRSSPFAHAACMVRKDAYNLVGGYSVDKKYIRLEDYNLWFRMYANGLRGFNLSEPLYKMLDDREAFSRRKYKYRTNEAYTKYTGFKMLKIPRIHYIYIIRPLLVGLLPKWLYDILRNN